MQEGGGPGAGGMIRCSLLASVVQHFIPVIVLPLKQIRRVPTSTRGQAVEWKLNQEPLAPSRYTSLPRPFHPRRQTRPPRQSRRCPCPDKSGTSSTTLLYLLPILALNVAP
jgi:hypothetical protein